MNLNNGTSTKRNFSIKVKAVMASAALLLVFGTTSLAMAGEISWTGCGITKKAFMSEVATAYEAKTGTKVKLSGGGATKGIRATAAGTSEMGGTCRHWLFDAPGSKRADEANANLTQVAWDALVAIAHPDNPVTDISSADLKKIYDGKITNWNALGGPDKRIVLVTRNGKASGVGYMFRLLAFNNADEEFKARSLKVKSTGPLEKKVETSAAAFGISGISSAKKRNVKFMSVDGIAPTKENIASGAYPLFRPLYIATGPTTSDDGKKLLEFIVSEEGQAIVSAQGTVNMAEGAALTGLWNKKKADLGM